MSICLQQLRLSNIDQQQPMYAGRLLVSSYVETPETYAGGLLSSGTGRIAARRLFNIQGCEPFPPHSTSTFTVYQTITLKSILSFLYIEKSFTTLTMASTQWQRVQAYCKTIWGADRIFDIEVEEIDEGSYLIFVREDRGTSFGNILLTMGCIKGYARTWNELERHVAELARAKETEGWTPKVQPLDATAYPHFNHDLNAKMEAVLGRIQRKGSIEGKSS